METEIKKLMQVVMVARRGNFSRAAEDLHITQPALSRSIAAFEERLGVRIFERGRNGATVTQVGRQIVADAEQLLRTVRAFDHNLKLYSSGHVGRVAFGLGPLISSLVMPGLGRHILDERPELLLIPVVRPARHLVKALMDDDIEMLFCAHGQLEPSAALLMEPVGEIAIGMFVRAGHPLAGEPQVSLEQLAPYPVLSGAEVPGEAAAALAGGVILDNYEILKALCLDSDGVWMSSPQLIREEIDSGRLHAVNVSDRVRPKRVTVMRVRRRECGLTPAAEVVMTLVCEELRRE